jgi:hypothetical protein
VGADPGPEALDQRGVVRRVVPGRARRGARHRRVEGDQIPRGAGGAVEQVGGDELEVDAAGEAGALRGAGERVGVDVGAADARRTRAGTERCDCGARADVQPLSDAARRQR